MPMPLAESALTGVHCKLKTGTCGDVPEATVLGVDAVELVDFVSLFFSYLFSYLLAKLRKICEKAMLITR